MDAPLVVGMLLVTNVLMSASKLTFSGGADSSIVGQLTFATIYVVAISRLIAFRSETQRLLKHSRALLAFLALNLLSTLWSTNAVVTFKGSIELIGTTAVAYYVVSRFALLDFLRLLSITFGLISAASLTLVVGSPVRGRDNWGSGPFSGIYGEKNGLGAVMALAVVTTLPLILQEKGKRRTWLLALLSLCVILLVGSNSVTAMLTCACSCAALLIALSCRRYGGRALFASVVGAAIVLLVLGLSGAEPQYILEALGRRPDLTGRADFWPGIIDAIKDRPILGFGYNAFFHAEGPYVDYLSNFIAETGFTPFHAHNSFLQIALGTGLLGLGLFVILLFVALRRDLINVARRTRPIAAWPLAIVAYLLLGSYSETYFAQFNTLEWILFVASFLYPIQNAPAES